MKKNTEKQPIDDLFARKLSNMSLPPSANGFERLQARMGQEKTEARSVFWRNPATQRYMAAAACLILVCLFGWLYKPSSQNVVSDGEGLAANQSKQTIVTKSAGKNADHETEEISPESPVIAPATEADNEQLAQDKKDLQAAKQPTRPTEQLAGLSKTTHQEPVPTGEAPVVAQTKTVGTEMKQPTPLTQEATPMSTVTTPQVADNTPAVKANSPAERVLVVTIEEPATLVAARQVVKEALEEKTLSANDKPEKEAKAGLWKQVKRFKQGEVFARRDNSANDDQGLLGRAYNGLKHSLEKDKSDK